MTSHPRWACWGSGAGHCRMPSHQPLCKVPQVDIATLHVELKP